MRSRTCQRRLYGMLVVAVLGLGWGSGARGDSIVTITPSQDSMIFQNNPDNSAGGAIVMYAGTNSASSPRRALVEFDVAANIPTGATIDSAQLTLTYATAAGGGGGGGGGGGAGVGDSNFYNIEIHRLLGNWGEGDRLNGQGPGGVGQGDSAKIGDVTWNYRFFDSPTWTKPGGDFVTTVSASTPVGGTKVNVPFTWGPTPQMVADVQQWLNNPSSNDGWILLGNETTSGTFRGLFTREETNTLFQPRLTVDYSVASAIPEPPSAWLALTGAFGMLICARLLPRRLAHRGSDRSNSDLGV